MNLTSADILKLPSTHPWRRQLEQKGAVRPAAPSTPAEPEPADPWPWSAMNGLERKYADHLDMLIRAGEVRLWVYESIKLRLADGAWFTPDFGVWFTDGRFEFHETKGFWREAARVRIKVAAGLYQPWRFVAIKCVKGEWVQEVIGR